MFEAADWEGGRQHPKMGVFLFILEGRETYLEEKKRQHEVQFEKLLITNGSSRVIALYIILNYTCTLLSLFIKLTPTTFSNHG